MKNTLWKTMQLTLFLLLVICGVVYAQKDETERALVMGVDGFVDVKFTGTDSFVSLSEKMRVGPGDVIETGDEGKVTLKLPDKSTLVIGEDSRVVIRELGMVEVTKVSTSTFELLKGKIRAIVNPFVNKESTFMIKTSNTTVGVRGTDFGETYDPDTDKTYILGLEDCVSLTLSRVPGAGPISLCAGNELTILGGGKPGNPTDASDATIEKFLKDMVITEGTGGTEEINPPYITSVFVNRIVNLEDIDGTLTLTQSDLSVDGKIIVSGTAVDEGYQVTGVEVSLDRGTTWNTAGGTTNWTYEFTPQENIEYEIMIRAKNEKGIYSDPWELGSWIVVYKGENYESIARSMLDKLFSAISTGDSSANDLISDYYDGVIDNIYTKSEVVDKITSSNTNVTASYTLNQVNSTGDAIIATIGWSATESGSKSEGTAKFWMAKYDEFRFIHSEGTWFVGGGPAELKLEVVPSSYGIAPCEKALRIILTAPNVPPTVSTITVYPQTTCESMHFAILTRTAYEDFTGETGGFAGDFHYEKLVSSCGGATGCSGTTPFLYSVMDPQVTVTFTEYGYNLTESITMPGL